MLSIYFFPAVLFFFTLAILIAYYFDYRKNKKDYKEKNQGKWYILIMISIICLLLFGFTMVVGFLGLM